MDKYLIYKGFMAAIIAVSIGFLSGIGMFVIQTVFLENSTYVGFFWSFLISPTLSMAYILSRSQNLKNNYYEEDDK